MKNNFIVYLMILVLSVFAMGATRGLVPRADDEGSIGTAGKSWATAFIHKITAILGFYIVDTATGMYVDGSGNLNVYDTNGGYLLSDLAAAASGGGASWRYIDLPAGAWDYPASNPAPLNTRTMTNITGKEHLFDDTTEEFVIAQLTLPGDLVAGTVTFTAKGAAVTADGNEIQLRFSHAAIDKNEDIDSASYSTKDSGDYSTSATQNAMDEVVWTETIANLGWSAGDKLYFKVSRIAITDGSALSGDWGLFDFMIDLPRG